MNIVPSPYAPVPVTTQLFHEKVLSSIEKHAKLQPNKPALISAEDPNIRITYGEIRDQAFNVSGFLSKHGIGYRDVVCQVLSNCIEYVVGYLASLQCGAAISGASALFTDYELERQFLDSQCKGVITDGFHLEKVMRAVKKCPLIKVIVCVDAPPSLPFKVYSWKEAVSFKTTQLPKFTKDVEDVAILPYSSGTTGSPKGVMLTHKNFGTMIDILVNHFETNAIPQLEGGDNWNWYEQTWFLMLPFYHIYGFGMCNLALVTGATGLIMTKFDPVIFLSNIEKYKMRILSLVPPIVLMLCRLPLVQKYDLSSIQIVLTGAAPCGKELCDEFYGRFKHVRFLLQGYGMTECGMASHLPMFDERNGYLTVGYAVANCEQKIVDPATGKALPRRQRGEICVRSPTVMKGYLNRPDATAETIVDGWLHTGDVGYIDEKGQTYIVDRIKELIKVKGLQVPPAELEDLLHGHPDIADVAVVGIPDPKVGERPKAYVVRAHSGLTEEQVCKYVESKVSSYKWLTGGVEFIEEIPKSAAGKILRRMLRERVSNSKI